MCVFGPIRVAYLSGFHFAATERPVALIVGADGDTHSLLPHLEADHFAHQCPDLPAPSRTQRTLRSQAYRFPRLGSTHKVARTGNLVVESTAKWHNKPCHLAGRS